VRGAAIKALYRIDRNRGEALTALFQECKRDPRVILRFEEILLSLGTRAKPVAASVVRVLRDAEYLYQFVAALKVLERVDPDMVKTLGLSTASDATERMPWELLNDQKLAGYWKSLGSDDSGQAYRSFWTMALAPQETVAFFKSRLHPAQKPGHRQLEELIARLDSDSAVARESATVELQKLELLAEPHLRRALEAEPSLEKQRRIEHLLELFDLAHSEQRRQMVRTIELLEEINDQESRKLLRVLGEGAPESYLTCAARDAATRLARRNCVEAGGAK
jgi:hypothetical protein